MNTHTYKIKLEEKKKLIEDQLGSLGIPDTQTGEWEAVPTEQTAPEADENDQADRSENFEERSAEMDVFTTRLTDINDALEKIKNGTYGVCEIGKEDIEEDRLQANPAARTCKAHM